MEGQIKAQNDQIKEMHQTIKALQQINHRQEKKLVELLEDDVIRLRIQQLEDENKLLRVRVQQLQKTERSQTVAQSVPAVSPMKPV